MLAEIAIDTARDIAYDQNDAVIVFADLNYPPGSVTAVVDDVTKTVLSGPTWAPTWAML